MPLLWTSAPRPALAVEELRLKLPLLGDSLSARVSELANDDALWNGISDLADLNRAMDGSLASSVEEVVNHPLPLQGLDGSPMVRQVEVILRQLIEVDGTPASSLHGEPLRQALQRVRSSGQAPTLLSLLREMPGDRVTIRLDRALPFLRRIKTQNQEVELVARAYPTMPAAPAKDLLPGPLAVQTRVSSITRGDGAEPLEVTVVRPVGTPTLAPVVISHGLWDAPASFMGWARHLASHGAPVFLPRHSGSDFEQQADMLAGRVPPPSPKEFLRRPADVRALLDALDAGRLPGAEGIQARNVTYIGHSWGGTTALQIAGARSLPSQLWKECASVDNPRRNLSWVLQCSFLAAATDASLADPRVVRVAAVSPPQGLVFAAGLVDLRSPVLLVSGSQDFVVPTRPEALLPFATYPTGSNELVLVEGGTHFNLPAPAESNGGPLRALLLRWVKGRPITPDSPVADPRGLPLRLIPLAPPRS